jgi:hypothetical protein
MFTSAAALRGYQRGLRLLTALTWCSVLGCGGPTYQPPPVGGVVLWQDGTEPRELEGGSVEFEANGAVAAKTALTADGTFRLDHALPPGSYRVRVTPPPGSPRPSALDPRFESFVTSGLMFTGTSEPQQVTFHVQKRGR